MGTADRTVAERRLRDVKFEAPGELISDAMRLYLEEKCTQGARSYQSMRQSWKALEPTFAHLRPDQITRDLCREYAKRRRNGGVQDGTILKDLGVLKAAIKFNGKGHLAVFAMPPTPPPRDRFITRAEFERLLGACTLPHVRLFILLAWVTGGRHSALVELTWDRVDFERRVIRLAKSPQGRKGRATVPFTDKTLAALREAHSARTCDFVIEWGGRPIKSIKRGFREAAGKAGIGDITPHVLRHSCAVRMAEAGYSMEEIGQYLGHTDPKTTYRLYARFSPDHLRQAAGALD